MYNLKLPETTPIHQVSHAFLLHETLPPSSVVEPVLPVQLPPNILPPVPEQVLECHIVYRGNFDIPRQVVLAIDIVGVLGRLL